MFTALIILFHLSFSVDETPILSNKFFSYFFNGLPSLTIDSCMSVS